MRVYENTRKIFFDFLGSQILISLFLSAAVAVAVRLSRRTREAPKTTEEEAPVSRFFGVLAPPFVNLAVSLQEKVL